MYSNAPPVRAQQRIDFACDIQTRHNVTGFKITAHTESEILQGRNISNHRTRNIVVDDGPAYLLGTHQYLWDGEQNQLNKFEVSDKSSGDFYEISVEIPMQGDVAGILIYKYNFGYIKSPNGLDHDAYNFSDDVIGTGFCNVNRGKS